jgi:hypothetical protein
MARASGRGAEGAYQRQKSINDHEMTNAALRRARNEPDYMEFASTNLGAWSNIIYRRFYLASTDTPATYDIHDPRGLRRVLVCALEPLPHENYTLPKEGDDIWLFRRGDMTTTEDGKQLVLGARVMYHVERVVAEKTSKTAYVMNKIVVFQK